MQVYFHIYNDSELILDFFIVQPNDSFADPLNYYTVSYSNLTADEKAVFTFASEKGPLEIVVSSFAAVSPTPYGRPSMTMLKYVATQINTIFDIFLDEEHLCSFKWQYTEIENQTLPQVIVYDNTGTQRDTSLITVALKPLIEYGGADGVGIMMDSFLEEMDIVKWILYSGRQINVRPNTGFGVRSLPYFTANPDKYYVNPNSPLTINFILPEGVTEYTSSLNGYLEYLADDPVHVYNPNTKEHTLTFSFNPTAKTYKFTISVRCEKAGIIYESSHSYTVVPMWQETTVPPAIVGSVSLFVIVLLVRWLWKSRREKPTSSEALGKGTVVSEREFV
jgi:hypothetical protein